MDINLSSVNLALYIISLVLLLALLIVLGINTISLVKKKKKNRPWVKSYIIFSISLSVLFRVLMAVNVCYDITMSTKEVFAESLRVLPALFIHPAWLIIIVLILVRYSYQKKLSKDLEAQGQDAENKPQIQKQSMIWFLCTLVSGVILTGWLHLQCGKDSLSPYLIILLIWIIIGMCMPVVAYIKQKPKVSSENKDI